MNGLILLAALCAGIPQTRSVCILDDPDAAWNRYDAAAVRARAARALKQRLSPVTEKKTLPESGDPHDYLSMGPYWWPNPATSNGLPYVRRDGEFNRENEADSDRLRLDRMTRDVMDLAAAGRLGDAAAGREAARRLRVFFLDPDTRMNPNLNHGQAIPGVCTGRGVGIIDTLNLARFTVDSILVLHQAGHLPDADLNGLKKWFAAYLDWLQTSGNGRDEFKARNNHGTNHDVQSVVYALFVGRDGLAREILRGVPQRRIDVQVEPDGRQPLELARTKALSYSSYNLLMLCDLALLGERQGVGLWNYVSADGRSIGRALAFLEPYWKDPSAWPYRQIEKTPPGGGRMQQAVRRHFDAQKRAN